MIHDPGPVTLGDMRRRAVLVEVCCENCSPHRHLYLPPDRFALPDTFPVPDLKRVLKCSACGIRNSVTRTPIWARPDARV